MHCIGVKKAVQKKILKTLKVLKDVARRLFINIE